jgi:hypothetical protein
MAAKAHDTGGTRTAPDNDVEPEIVMDSAVRHEREFPSLSGSPVLSEPDVLRQERPVI